jgi:hypothetical protein
MSPADMDAYGIVRKVWTFHPDVRETGPKMDEYFRLI